MPTNGDNLYIRPSYSMESSVAIFTTRPDGTNVIDSPIFMLHMLNLKRERLTSLLTGVTTLSPNIGLFSLYKMTSASSIVIAISLNMSRATWGATLKNSLFWRIRRSVNRSMVLCTNFSTSLYLHVLIAANISKGNGTAVLSSSFDLISTGRALFPILTQSSLKLGLVNMYTYPCSEIFIVNLRHIAKVQIKFNKFNFLPSN